MNREEYGREKWPNLITVTFGWRDCGNHRNSDRIDVLRAKATSLF
jgi:hypothetical protein